MRKIRTIAIIAAVISVFVLSFLIGRVSAGNNGSDSKRINRDIYTGTVKIPQDQSEEDEAVETNAEEKKVKKIPVPKEETWEITPPERMIFPCGNNLQKPYSEAAVYSETMDDWRAHEGADYSAPLKTEVKAAWDGKVMKIYKDKLWGNIVEIYHGGGVTVRYCNLSGKTAVKKGQIVKCGNKIGEVGKSASIESKEPPHIHIEIYQDGIRINPESYLY